MVHAYTKNRDCLVTVEDTLLGYLFDELTWCSKNESKGTAYHILLNLSYSSQCSFQSLLSSLNKFSSTQKLLHCIPTESFEHMKCMTLF